jgi:hypothetical protein
MSKSSKKPRQKQLDPRQISAETPKKKEKDWSFDDIAKSKYRR